MARKGGKKKLAWTPEAEDAFNRLKERLLGQLGLFLVDLDKGFVLRTDASDYAVGAVLEQVRDDGTHVPVAFWSRILAEGQRRTWTAREKETYAIVCALRKWSGHIGLQPVVVCTDHHPYRAGTRSMSTPPQDQRLRGPDHQVRPQRRVRPGEGQHCGRLPQSLGLPRGQGVDGHIQPWRRRGDRGGQAHHRDGEGHGARGGHVFCGDGEPYRPGQFPGRPSPGYSRENPRAMDGGPCRASQVGAHRGLVG